MPTTLSVIALAPTTPGGGDAGASPLDAAPLVARALTEAGVRAHGAAPLLGGYTDDDAGAGRGAGRGGSSGPGPVGDGDDAGAGRGGSSGPGPVGDGDDAGAGRGAGRVWASGPGLVGRVADGGVSDGAAGPGGDHGATGGYAWARWPVEPVDDGDAVRQMLRSVLRPDPVAQAVPGVDLAVVPDALHDGGRLLLVMDVDSTLIQQEVIELLAAHAGREAEVAAVTDSAMRGELDFAASLHARVEALAGLPVSVIDDVCARVRLSPGAERLVTALLADGHHVAAVSGGFTQVLAPLADRLGLTHYRANDLDIADGRLTGRVSGDVVDRAVKAASLRAWATVGDVAADHVIAVGDGANDLDMLAEAGLSVAYNAKPALRHAADAQLNLPRLDAVGALIGLPGF